MTEIFAVQDVPDDAKRQQWAVWSATIWQLLQRRLLGQAALEYLRQELRVGSWRAELVVDSHRTQHPQLLHDVTTQLLEHVDPSLRTYYDGDLLPKAPDSPAGLDGAA